tara:strand:+ start:235 stop:405 length:171 start_codon:yes stop_codon:yes gene_type:complete
MVETNFGGDERKGNNHFNTGDNSSSETSFGMNFTELVGIREDFRVSFDGTRCFITE